MFKITLYITPFIFVFFLFAYIAFSILKQGGKSTSFWGNSTKDQNVSSGYKHVKTEKRLKKKPRRSSLNIEEHEG